MITTIANPAHILMPATPLAESRPAGTPQRHICVVTETYPPEVNGVTLTLSHLVRGLLARGHVVSVVRPYQQESGSTAGTGGARETVVRGLPLPGYKGLQFGLPAGGVLRRAWRQRRPDVVYVATEGPLGWSAVRSARRLGIPTVSGFHTNFHSFAKHYHAGWLRPWIFRYLRGFHNRTRGTLVPCVEQRDRLQALGFENASILGRGVDSQLFAPERRCAELRHHWGVSNNELVALYVGRVAPEKNLALAVAAYRAMRRCSASMKFVIVGDGPLCATLQKEHPDLIFCGVHTGTQLAKHYAAADVFLFPSETETFGNVTLEAMASGLVVIAYNYAAAKMHIRHGETGVLVPYGEPRAFVDSAVKVTREPQFLQPIRQRARQYVAAVSWQQVIERFETLLTDALGQSHTAVNSPITH
jgi:glycosyltransferase involved in cell wall biosynthesis